MRKRHPFAALKLGKADRVQPSEKQRKSPETKRFQGFFGGYGLQKDIFSVFAYEFELINILE